MEAVCRTGPECAPDAATPMRIGGVVPFSTSDWPDRLAAVVFLQGCPWRCGYCQNPHLLSAQGAGGDDWDAVLAWLATRRGLLDGVVFSGGEPTAQAGLGDAIRAVRALGFAVGLHTGGAYPRRLFALAAGLDWVGLDIKAPMLDYVAVTGVPRSGVAAFASLDLLRKARVAHEVRTTVHPALTPHSTLVALAGELAAAGVTRWVLQAFQPTGCASTELIGLAPQGAAIEASTLAALRAIVPEIELR
jgi:pyruvate formate lyase activating enzyme